MLNLRFSFSVLFCFAFCVTIGCGSGSTVTGKVTFPDGAPLTVGKVMFTNGTLTAFGQIDANGEYRMGTKKAKDGVPNGTYQVYIAEALIPGDASLARKDDEGAMFTPMVLAVAPKLTIASQSGLTCEVKGTTKYDISVEKPPAGYSPFAKPDAAAPRRSSD